MTSTETVDKQALLDSPIFWPSLREQLAELDPEYFAAFLKYRDAVMANNPLDAKTREIIAIAVDVTVTHLYGPGIRKHIERALSIGITPEEIMAVIKMATLLGSHSLAEGVPPLAEALARAGNKPV